MKKTERMSNEIETLRNGKLGYGKKILEVTFLVSCARFGNSEAKLLDVLGTFFEKGVCK